MLESGMDEARARTAALAIAALHGIEIETDKGRPRAVRGAVPDYVMDPFGDDHTATTWRDALAMVQVYSEIALELDAPILAAKRARG